MNQLESNISSGSHLSTESVFASWEMSLETLRKRVPNAIDLLSICGFLDHEEISDEFLRRGMVEKAGRSDLFVFFGSMTPVRARC